MFYIATNNNSRNDHPRGRCMQLTTKNAAVLSCLVPRARAVHVIACRLARWALQYVCRIMSAKSPVEFHAQGLKLIWRQKYAFVAGVGISGPYGR